MTFFTQAFLSTVRDDPYVAVLAVCEHWKHLSDASDDQHWSSEEIDFLMEAYAFMEEVTAANLFTTTSEPVELTARTADDCVQISRYLREVKSEVAERATRSKHNSLRKTFGLAIGTGFAYEFTQGDLDRVQILINELREVIKVSDLYDEDHKTRMLSKLEKLQRELHKKMADLDKFWGLMSEAGVAFGKFGTNAKPLFDRINEITQIAWQTQKRAEELPSDAAPPRLEHQTPKEPPLIT